MNSRSLIILSRCIVLMMLLVSAVHWSAGADAVASKPHIVFILTDDLSTGDVGCYGGTIAPTPNLDRLAREGTRFTRYYSAAPICSPSLARSIGEDAIRSSRSFISQDSRTRVSRRFCATAPCRRMASLSSPAA